MIIRIQTIGRFGVVTFMLVCSLLSRQSLADPLKFAPLPLEDRKIIHEQFHGLVDYLHKETGYDVEMVHLSDYAEIIEKFRRNEVDLAYLGPLPYVILKRDFDAAQPLVCFRDVNGAASYTCSLITYGDSGLELNKLKGVHFGLTQPYSTCGYLAVTQMLEEVGLSLARDGNTFEYAGSHSKAALGVAQGVFDVAGVKTAIARRYQHLDLEMIAQSRDFPGFALVANTNNLDRETMAKLQEALLALQPASKPLNGTLVSGWGKHLRQGTVPPGECDYSGVSKALRHIPSPIPGAKR